MQHCFNHIILSPCPSNPPGFIRNANLSILYYYDDLFEHISSKYKINQGFLHNLAAAPGEGGPHIVGVMGSPSEEKIKAHGHSSAAEAVYHGTNGLGVFNPKESLLFQFHQVLKKTKSPLFCFWNLLHR